MLGVMAALGAYVHGSTHPWYLVMSNRVNLSIGRGEKRKAKDGAGLTAKGRAKYNRETGSNLKAPVTGKGEARSC